MHLVVVEAYEGIAEMLGVEAGERAGARGLGLPLAELAERLPGRVSVLCWDEWIRLEHAGRSFTNWMPVPVTRPAAGSGGFAPAPRPTWPGVQWMDIPAIDPDHGRPIADGLSPLAHGLLAQSDPLFLMSYCLNQTLQAMHRRDPIDVVIVPGWGGLGYVAQMARATEIDARLDVPFVALVTDTSANRQRANQEGLWNRPAVTRRQMEELSLGLADSVFVFGPRAEAIACAGRLHDAPVPVHVPRRLDPHVLSDIEASMSRSGPVADSAQFFLYEPQQPAAGALLALDAVTQLQRRGVQLKRPVICAGPAMVFAPMAPRTFENYWASRGFVRELTESGRWQWSVERPAVDGALTVRLYPSLFEHLPDIWSELARGSLVLLSPAAAEGMAGVPAECCLAAEPTAETVATAIERLARMSAGELDALRRALCRAVLEAQRSPQRERMIESATAALRGLCAGPPMPQDLARVSRLLLDRRRSLLACEQAFPIARVAAAAANGATLSVVVTCYEMGAMVTDAVRSIWASDRLPDEVLLIDDGSHGQATLEAIDALRDEAAANRRPLRVIRQDNRGLAAARNAGLQAATSDFISFLDGDDIIEPAFYRTALALLRRYPGLGGVAAWSLCLGPGETVGFWNAPQPELPFLYSENCVFVPCMVRTALLRELGGYDTRQRYNYEDWELSCRMLAAGWPIVTLPAYLQKYFIRSESLLRTMTPVQNQVMREQFLDQHRETVSRFAMELTMLFEGRLMQRLHADAMQADARRREAERGEATLIHRGKSAARATLRLLRLRRE
jgi:GT2 family glycosyltransferase